MKKNIKPSDILLLIVATILIAVNIYIYTNKLLKPSKISNDDTTTVEDTVKMSEQEVEDKEKQEKIENLKKLGEKDRVEIYFSEYMSFIENKKYEDAYNLLYPEFKENYFKTLEDFEKYAKEKFPEMLSIQYDNIERQGDIYVLFITISNLDDRTQKFEQKIVVKEYNFDDFVLSFTL